MKRLEIQKVASEKMLKTFGIYDIACRVGKSKITIDFLDKKEFNKCLIVTPYISIKDNWKQEFIKWSKEYLLDKVDIICAKSGKIYTSGYDFIIVDEVHTLSPNQMNSLKGKPIIGLTGTLGYNSKKKLKDVLGLKTVFTYDMESAIRDKIISDYRIKVHSVTLSYPEKLVYKEYNDAFEKMKKLSFFNKKLEVIKMAKASARANYIYTNKTKINKVFNDVENSEGQKLIFTARTEIADYFGNSYHSKTTEKGILERFLSNEIDRLSVVNMANMGISFPDVKRCFIHQLNSGVELAVQRIMRVCMIDNSENIADINVYVCENTVDEDWVNNALSEFDKTKIQYVV